MKRKGHTVLKIASMIEVHAVMYNAHAVMGPAKECSSSPMVSPRLTPLNNFSNLTANTAFHALKITRSKTQPTGSSGWVPSLGFKRTVTSLRSTPRPSNMNSQVTNQSPKWCVEEFHVTFKCQMVSNAAVPTNHTPVFHKAAIMSVYTYVVAAHLKWPGSFGGNCTTIALKSTSASSASKWIGELA